MRRLDNLKDLEIFAASAGGKLLVSGLKKDIVSLVDQLSGYHKLSHIEMIAIAAALDEKLTIVRALAKAGKSREELENLIEDAFDDIEE